MASTLTKWSAFCPGTGERHTSSSRPMEFCRDCGNTLVISEAISLDDDTTPSQSQSSAASLPSPQMPIRVPRSDIVDRTAGHKVPTMAMIQRNKANQKIREQESARGVRQHAGSLPGNSRQQIDPLLAEASQTDYAVKLCIIKHSFFYAEESHRPHEKTTEERVIINPGHAMIITNDPLQFVRSNDDEDLSDPIQVLLENYILPEIPHRNKWVLEGADVWLGTFLNASDIKLGRSGQAPLTATISSNKVTKVGEAMLKCESTTRSENKKVYHLHLVCEIENKALGDSLIEEQDGLSDVNVKAKGPGKAKARSKSRARTSRKKIKKETKRASASSAAKRILAEQTSSDEDTATFQKPWEDIPEIMDALRESREAEQLMNALGESRQADPTSRKTESKKKGKTDKVAVEVERAQQREQERDDRLRRGVRTRSTQDNVAIRSYREK